MPPSGVSESPLPVPKAVRPNRQAGTSAPSEAAISISRGSARSTWWSRPKPRSVAAASAGVTTAAPLLGWRPVAQSADPRLAKAWTVTINAGRRAAASIAAAHPTPIRPWRMDRQGAEPVQPDVRRDTAASVPAATA